MTGLKCTLQGFYMGIKTGVGKSGNAWSAHQFKCDEYYKGLDLKSEQLSQPNMTIFSGSVEPSVDVTKLLVGQKYHLSCASEPNSNWRLIACRPITFVPAVPTPEEQPVQ
jgi:hypothetical protein